MLDIKRPSEVTDDEIIVAAGYTRFDHFYSLRYWDDGYGPVFGYAETLGLVGVVRAKNWDDAWSATVDEIMHDADEDVNEEDECVHFRGSGTPSNEGLKSHLAQEDPNGSRLDRLPDKEEDDREYWLIVERE